VLELDDLVDRPVDLDVISVFELVGADDGRSALSRAKFQCGSHQAYERLVTRRATARRVENQSTSLHFDFNFHLTNSQDA